MGSDHLCKSNMKNMLCGHKILAEAGFAITPKADTQQIILWFCLRRINYHWCIQMLFLHQYKAITGKTFRLNNRNIRIMEH